MFQKCFDKQACLTFEVRAREASQKIGGSLTARASSATSSTLVPISEEDATSVNEMIAEDINDENLTPNSQNS